ncbi:hypothetical protein CCMA1212_004465 [Trichoderma ghanense]|uniref:Uncharacterized protein n=1 Tax=Trichoderma ghanense TaxID=65468 RepID=A0ABY2H6G0_9HYPO
MEEWASTRISLNGVPATDWAAAHPRRELLKPLPFATPRRGARSSRWHRSQDEDKGPPTPLEASCATLEYWQPPKNSSAAWDYEGPLQTTKVQRGEAYPQWLPLRLSMARKREAAAAPAPHDARGQAAGARPLIPNERLFDSSHQCKAAFAQRGQAAQGPGLRERLRANKVRLVRLRACHLPAEQRRDVAGQEVSVP